MVTTPASYAGAMVLNVTESWTNADGSIGTAKIADNVEAYAPGMPIVHDVSLVVAPGEIVSVI